MDASGNQDSPTWRVDDLFCADLDSKPIPEIGKVLVTGASGYIGGRLVPELIARGYDVRVLVRAPSPEYEEWWPEAEVVVGDVLNADDLYAAMDDVHTAYYLVHSLVRGPKEFETADLEAARNFRESAEKLNLQRVIYLGGVGAREEDLSDHLRSRLEVAEVLKKGIVPVTHLRAAIIIGSGSASYEIIQHLAKNLPVILIPRWAKNMCQPIAIRDVIKYLVGVLEQPETSGQVLDIGGPDVLSYEQMMKVLVDVLHIKRLFMPFPISWIGLYSYVASLITPVPGPITRCLMEGLKSDAVCNNDTIKNYLPFKPLPYREAVLRAMTREELDRVSTRWSDAYPPAHELAMKLGDLKEAPRYSFTYFLDTDKPSDYLYARICKIGGKVGWFHTTWLWKIRGAIDRILFSGVGTARGRRSSSKLKVNDVIDFWRVEDLKENECVLLRGEFWLPGKAWLKFDIDDEGEKRKLTVTALFATRGLHGKIYWYFFYPFHSIIFKDLLRHIAGIED